MYDQRIGGRATFGREDFAHRLLIQRIAAQPINRLRRKGHKLTLADQCRGVVDGFWRESLWVKVNNPGREELWHEILLNAPKSENENRNWTVTPSKVLHNSAVKLILKP